MSKITRIDGSYLEGGGQIMRIALPLAAILRKHLRIDKIRAGRPKPGLANQHLACVLAIGDISSGDIDGAHIGSSCVEFAPSTATNTADNFHITLATAGAISLVIQAVLSRMVMTESTLQKKLCLTITGGGTDVSFSPPLSHTTNVLLPLLRTMGIQAVLSIDQRGYFPKGLGKAVLTTTPVSSLLPIQLVNQGNIVKLMCSVVSNRSSHDYGEGISLVPSSIELVQSYLSDKMPNVVVLDAAAEAGNISCKVGSGVSSTEVVQEVSTVFSSSSATINITTNNTATKSKKKRQANQGQSSSQPSAAASNSIKKSNLGPITLSIQLSLITDTGSILSGNALWVGKDKGSGATATNPFFPIPLRDVVREACDDLLRVYNSGACVCERTADQLLLYMAMAIGPSAILVEPAATPHHSQHIDTAVHVIQQLIGTGSTGTSTSTCGPVQFHIDTHVVNGCDCRLITCTGSESGLIA